ncbi:hypothetical protein Cgig2_013828 [Carnegiea gigantea]|uniref:Uncharacterized protein n=1 Tax=Carnegiea gigantea TaxID=171969 RepID=A0A9Q1JWU5_9CARY|nr:hypothetical protein Cgig2_013828 [Carnegiea gigantea]
MGRWTSLLLFGAYDIDPMPAPTFIPQLLSEVTSVVNTVRYGGWTDDTYLFTLPSGREAAQLNIRLTTLNELNSVMYEVSNATTAYHCGFTSSVPPVTCQEVRIYVWNCRGLAQASFRPNLFTMTSIRGVYVVVLIDTLVMRERSLTRRTTSTITKGNPLVFLGGLPFSGTAPKWKCVASLGMTRTCLVL